MFELKKDTEELSLMTLKSELGNKQIAQLTQIFTHVLQRRCS